MNKKQMFEWLALGLIGTLASAMTINFSGPYLANLPSNPFRDTPNSLIYGYAWASVLEVLTAMTLFMLHVSPIQTKGFWPGLFLAPAGRQWMRVVAGLALAAQLGCAFMEDARPALAKLQSDAQAQITAIRLDEAKRLESFVSDLGPRKNPINSIKASEEIAKHRQAVIADLATQSNDWGSKGDLSINALLKLACIAIGGTAFYLAGLFWFATQPIEAINLATNLQEVATSLQAVATNLQPADPRLQPEPDSLQTPPSLEEPISTQPIEANNLATNLQEVATSLQPAPDENLLAQMQDLQTRLVELEQSNQQLQDAQAQTAEAAKKTINSLQRDLQQAQALSVLQLNIDSYRRLQGEYGFRDLEGLAVLINKQIPIIDPMAKPISSTDLSRVFGKSHLVLNAIQMMESRHAA